MRLETPKSITDAKPRVPRHSLKQSSKGLCQSLGKVKPCLLRTVWSLMRRMQAQKVMTWFPYSVLPGVLLEGGNADVMRGLCFSSIRMLSFV